MNDGATTCAPCPNYEYNADGQYADFQNCMSCKHGKPRSDSNGVTFECQKGENHGQS